MKPRFRKGEKETLISLYRYGKKRGFEALTIKGRKELSLIKLSPRQTLKLKRMGIKHIHI